MDFYKKLLCAVLVASLAFSCSSDNDNDQLTITDDDGNPITVDISSNTKPTGASARDLLSQEQFTELIVEIVYVEGHRPTGATVDNFKLFLEERLHKSGGIEVLERAVSSPGITSYTIDDIISKEEEFRKKYNAGNKIAVYAFFADGEFSGNTENSSVLGAAYRNTSFIIFEETIREFSSAPLSPSHTVLETTVVNHEFSHLLGLVNVGTPLQSNHQDTEHGKHCTVEDCLMFWTAETGEGLVNMISGGTVPSLDSQCIADLQGNGGK